jgi:hypothetical protein
MWPPGHEIVHGQDVYRTTVAFLTTDGRDVVKAVDVGLNK